jgi:hypothetical protein
MFVWCLGGIFLAELIYRPPFRVTAGFGFAALLLWCFGITAKVLVSMAF